MTIGIILFVIIWWLIGLGGFIFWWTSEYDMTTYEIPLAIGIGFMGPISWVLGGMVHGNSNNSNISDGDVLLKKRVR